MNTAINSLFHLYWANDQEKAWLCERLTTMGRQTMNIRLMKDAKFVMLKTQEGVPIGWGGLDVSLKKEYPEMFSLYLDPAFRKYALGMMIELTRASYVLSQGIRHTFVRMTNDDLGADLMSKRLQSGFYSEVDSQELDFDYVQMCKSCELYESQCRKRIFLKFDVEKFYNQSVGEIGTIDSELPKWFRLVRVGEKQLIASGDKNEPVHLWRSYRPLWIKI